MAQLKQTVYFVVFMVVSSGLLYGALHIFVFSEFKRIERNDAGFGLTQALAAIRADNLSLHAWVRDIGPWDDTYQFAKTSDPAYIASNYDPQAIGNLGFDLIFFADSSDSVLWSYVSGTKTIKDLRYEELLQSIRQRPDWESSTGLVGLHRMDANTVYIIAAHPIQTSDYGGPSRGTTLLGIRLDNARFEKIIASSVADFDLQVIGNDPVSDRIVQSVDLKNDALVVRRENGETKAYTILRDLNDESAVIMAIRAHADTTRNGAASIRYVMYSYFLVTFLALVGYLVISKRGER